MPYLNRTHKIVGGTVLAGLLAIAVPYIAGWEGKSNDPYFDSVHVSTVCYGETDVVMRHYTDAECKAMLAKRVAEFAIKVQQISPGIQDYKYMWLSFTSFSYNLGIATYSKSSVRRLLDEGDFIGACRAMTKYKYAGGKVLIGLVYRREGKDERIGESELCMVDAIPATLNEGAT